MRVILLLLSSACVVFGYVNVLLVGPFKDTYPLAKHYSEFYNVPCLEKVSYFFPQHFVVVSEQKNDVDGTMTFDIKDYPHKGKKNHNYFISWVKQNS